MFELSELYLSPADAAPGALGIVQVLTQIVFFAVWLVWGAMWMADGADMLTLLFDADFVCAVVVPLLGALPDGIIILFSALGDDAQSQINVGVGTLAGSTNLLITVAIGAAAWQGAVDVSAGGALVGYRREPRLTPHRGLWARLASSGIVVTPAVLWISVIMLSTTLPYVVAQGVAFAYGGGDANAIVAWVVFGCTASCLGAYLLFQRYSVTVAAATKTTRAAAALHRSDAFSIEELLALEDARTSEQQAPSAPDAPGGDSPMALHAAPTVALCRSTRHLQSAAGVAAAAALRAVYRRADTDGNRQLDAGELTALLTLCTRSKRPVPSAVVAAILRDQQVAGDDGRLSEEEWVAFAFNYFAPSERAARAAAATAAAGSKQPPDVGAAASQDSQDAGEEEEEGEADDDESEHAALTRAQLQWKAARLLLCGLALVTLFSDPMVGAVTELSSRINLPVFYVSYVVNPLVSNASELITMLFFVARRTQQSARMALNTLLGAAIMNNTFCTLVLTGLIAGRALTWQFSAEVISIVATQVVLVAALWCSPRAGSGAAGTRVLYSGTGLLIAAAYIGALALVFVLENVAGWN